MLSSRFIPLSELPTGVFLHGLSVLVRRKLGLCAALHKLYSPWAFCVDSCSKFIVRILKLAPQNTDHHKIFYLSEEKVKVDCSLQYCWWVYFMPLVLEMLYLCPKSCHFPPREKVSIPTVELKIIILARAYFDRIVQSPCLIKPCAPCSNSRTVVKFGWRSSDEVNNVSVHCLPGIYHQRRRASTTSAVIVSSVATRSCSGVIAVWFLGDDMVLRIYKECIRRKLPEFFAIS